MWIALSGALEELDGGVVLLVQAEAVADDAPGLWRQLVVLGELLGESGERDLLLQVPQRGALVLEAVQVIGILASQLRVDTLGPLVVVNLEVGLGHVVEHKARVELRLRQERKVLERLVALELLEVVVGVGELLVDAHELLDETCLIGTEQLARRRRCNHSRRGCGCCFCCRCCFGLFKARTERHLLLLLLLLLLLIGGEEGGLRLVGEQVAVATLGVCGRRAAVLVLMVVDVNDVVVGVHGVQIGAFLIVVVGVVDGDGDRVLLLLLVVLVVVVRARGGAFLQALSLDLRRRRR